MKTKPKSTSDLATISFKTRKEWDNWLARNHQKSPGLWIKLARKTSGIKSISYPEALECALCYGWIDAQKKGYDESFWLQRFTPRGPRSIWSKINRTKASELIESGRMKPAGLSAIERAKQDGRWDRAYDSPGSSKVPADFQSALDENAKAKAFFATLNSANRFAILFRLQTAKKSETRLKRIEQFIRMLENNEKLHP